jgi:hypothetical protein
MRRNDADEYSLPIRRTDFRVAMGAYTAFLDLAQGLASPMLGLLATGAMLNVVFLASAVTVLFAAVVAVWLIAHPAPMEGSPQ